jgi:serine/threonine protein phosphatase PrpC
VVLKVTDEFILLATDGYWDVVSPEMAVMFVRNMLQRNKDQTQICEELTQMAVRVLLLCFYLFCWFNVCFRL